MDIVNLDEFKVVGMQIHTAFKNKDTTIPKLWDDYIPKSGFKKGDVCYGVCSGDMEEFDYLAGMKSSGEVPEGFVELTVKGGRYAKFLHQGHVSKLDVTFAEIFDKFLPEAGEKPDLERATFERYGDKYTDDDNCEFEVYVPLK